MNLRQVLNAAWALACDGLERKGVEEMEAWLNSKTKTPQQEAEEERKRKARENKAGFADLAQAFSLGD